MIGQPVAASKVLQSENLPDLFGIDLAARSTSAVASSATAATSRSKRGRKLGLVMGIGEAKEIAGTLGKPSKMPGYSFGLNAFVCQTGGKLSLIPGSTCFNCFAKKNYYKSWWPAVTARRRREEGLEHPRWVDALVTLINRYCVGDENHFRWHDSGDIRHVQHLERIVEVCLRTPQIKHWLPTKEYGYVALFLAAGGVIPDNLCIRLSAYMIDTEPVVPRELAHLPTATVHTWQSPVEGKGAIVCQAIEKRDNMCGPCRACWSNGVRNVSYPEH